MKKIAINGFGRIGRLAFRNIKENIKDLEVVAINDLTDNETLLHLLQNDSSYGKFEGNLDGVKLFSEKDPSNLPWKDLEVDIVLECTGVFRKYDDAMKHITAGAKKVLISAPSKDPDKIKSYVMGVNDSELGDEQIIDMASCTTNCLAPIAKILNDNFKIKKGLMTTVHSYTNDQKILDTPHKDLRRARSAGLSIIPTTTGAAKATERVIPELKGCLDGMAMRVPTPTVSIVDFVCEIEKETTVEEIIEIFKKNEIPGIFRVEEKELVSMDYKGEGYSSVLDAKLTKVNGNMVKILAWYDNEWGYAKRLGEFCKIVADKTA